MYADRCLGEIHVVCSRLFLAGIVASAYETLVLGRCLTKRVGSASLLLKPTNLNEQLTGSKVDGHWLQKDLEPIRSPTENSV
jgi:hypothetical protein